MLINKYIFNATEENTDGVLIIWMLQALSATQFATAGWAFVSLVDFRRARSCDEKKNVRLKIVWNVS